VVLAELAEVVPAFAVARGGVVPEFGVVLGEPQPADDTTFPFADPWLAPQGRQSALLEHPLPKVEPAPVGST
jgi:hypothetical protein